MPADYNSTARALALPISPDHSPTATHHRQPSWIRRQSGLPSNGSSSSNQQRSGIRTRIRRYYRTIESYGETIEQNFKPWQIYLSFCIGICTIVLGILFLIYNERIFSWIEPYAEKWKNLRGGWIILWLMTFTTSFPPIIGYSSTLTIAGFVYGVPKGWLIVATSTILGSTLSFLTSRYLFSAFIHRLTAHDTRFTALSLVLQHDGLRLLCMIRLCPLPYSLSNGAISTFPSVAPQTFALATALVTPKLLIHVFIGSRLAAIAKSGEKMSAGTRAINWASIVAGMVLGLGTGWYIYRRTTARAREVELEAADENAPSSAAAAAAAGGAPATSLGRQHQRPFFPASVRGFSDEPDGHETATLLEDDQIDFLDPEANGGGGGRAADKGGPGYRDGFDDEYDDDSNDNASMMKLGVRDEEDAIGLDDQPPARR